MDIVFNLGEASVAEVVERMPGQPGYNAVRNTMAILERKGYLTHHRQGQRYLYSPAGSLEKAKRSAARHLLDTFFEGSLPKAVLAMLGVADRKISAEELDEVARYIESARKERR